MLNNQVPKSKPQGMATTSPQGAETNDNSNSTTNGLLKDSRSRYEKGMELYKSGKVAIGSNGLFKVSGYYEADTERMTCTCPDYRTRKESCKHLFAAMLFVKNRGKQSIENLAGYSNGVETKPMVPSVELSDKPKPEASPSEKIHEGAKPFDRQSTITRLAVLNTATEILKTHRKPIEFSDIVSLAAELEKWALGGGAA